MKKERSEEELFEKMPVPKAVATLAVPTIIGQIVTMSYNLADTFFVGQMGNLLRSEGHARQASIGMMFGGILNVVLDPVLIFGFHLDVAGAAIAIACSNLASVVFFIVIYLRLKKRTAVSLRPNYFSFRFIRQIFSVGLASALATTLGNASNMVIIKLAAGYGDIPVAAYGIVKRIDQFPLNISMGLCQGFMPLVGYNFASGGIIRECGKSASYESPVLQFRLRQPIS